MIFFLVVAIVAIVGSIVASVVVAIVGTIAAAAVLIIGTGSIVSILILILFLIFSFTPSVAVSVWRVSGIMLLISPVDESVGAGVSVGVGVGGRFSSVRGSDSDRGRVHRQAVCELHFARCVLSFFPPPAVCVPPSSKFQGCVSPLYSPVPMKYLPGTNLKHTQHTRLRSYPDATSVRVPYACAGT